MPSDAIKKVKNKSYFNNATKAGNTCSSDLTTES